MSRNCGLKKLMCPGPLLGSCPFSRDDCSFHENSDGPQISTTGLFGVTKIVEQIVQRGHSDTRATGQSGFSAIFQRDQSDDRANRPQ